MEKIHNEELYNLYSSPNIIILIIIKSKIRWVGHVARMGEMRCVHNFGRKTQA